MFRHVNKTGRRVYSNHYNPKTPGFSRLYTAFHCWLKHVRFASASLSCWWRQELNKMGEHVLFTHYPIRDVRWRGEKLGRNVMQFFLIWKNGAGFGCVFNAPNCLGTKSKATATETASLLTTCSSRGWQHQQSWVHFQSDLPKCHQSSNELMAPQYNRLKIKRLAYISVQAQHLTITMAAN